MNKQGIALALCMLLALLADGIMDAFGPLLFALISALALLAAGYLATRPKKKKPARTSFDYSIAKKEEQNHVEREPEAI